MKITILWFLGFCTLMLIFYRFIRFESVFLSVIYFSAVSFALFFYQLHLFDDLIDWLHIHEIFFLVLIITLHIMVAFWWRQQLSPPTISSISFLTFDNYFLWVKPFDVMFQQTLILWLVGMLRRNFTILVKIISILVLFFGIFHSILIIMMGWQWWLYFTSFAVIASIVFPILMTRLHNGWVYSYSIHLLFYSISAVVFVY